MRTLTIMAGAALLLLAAISAYAHALLDRAEPRVGSVVRQAPHEVALTFTQNLEGSFSTLEVTDAAGQRVDEGTPAIQGNVMRVPVKTLPPGVYRVKWHVLSVDTHQTEGSFTFEVRP
jgi:methionine-rich copper-binding protein CopC